MSSPAAPLLQYLLQPLRQWLDDAATEDVAINAPGRAWVRHHGAWEGVEVPLSFDDLDEIAILAGSLRQQESRAAISPLRNRAAGRPETTDLRAARRSQRLALSHHPRS